jgi:hypothetical protein
VGAIVLFIIYFLIMKEVLEAKGWIMYYDCITCGHKQYFNHPDKKDYEIRAKKNNNTFSILLNEMIIAGPFWGYELEEKLNANGI